AETHDALNSCDDRRIEHVLRSEHVGAHSLHGMEFTGGHLLQRRGMEAIVHTAHYGGHRALIAHVADVKFEPRLVVALAHVVLLLLVAAEDTDFSDIGGEKASQDRVAERAGASGDEQYPIVKHMHPANERLRVRGPHRCARTPGRFYADSTARA